MAKTPVKTKSSKKEKSEKTDVEENPVDPSTLIPFAKPLADPKLNKKLFKTIKKATKAKSIKRGVKEVVKAIKKGEKGIVVMAGNISPMDVLSHLPVFCEEANIPYIFVPAKEELGSAASTKRSTCIVMVVSKDDSDFKDYYDGCHEQMVALNAQLVN